MMAVDPFSSDIKPNRVSALELGNWLEEHEASLELVYVVPSPAFDKSFDTHKVSRFLMKEYAKLIGLSQVKLKILHAVGHSKRDLVAALLEYADEQAADFIVLTSSGSHLVGRLVQGSFADLVIADSSVPVLVMGSKSFKSAREWNRVAVYPTDYSQDSHRGLLIFLSQFRHVVDEVLIFNAVVPKMNYSMMGIVTVPDHYWEEQIEFSHEEGSRWVRLARSYGYQASSTVDTSSFDVATSIKKFAEHAEVGMIGIASVNTAPRARVIECISSKLFYLRSFPVWVCGPSVLTSEENRFEKVESTQELFSGRPIL